MESNPLFSTLRDSCEPRLHWGQAMCFAAVALVVACATTSAVRELKTEPAVVTWRQVATSDFVPLEAVVLLRLACARAALDTLLRVYFDTVGVELRYLDAKVKLIRLQRWTTFTVWCFTLLFFYFALATFCSTAALLSRGDIVPYAVVVLTLILFEISYPTSLLVTAVVAFILLPAALKNHYPTARMFR